MKKITLLLLAVFFGFVSCSKDDDTPPPVTEYDQTVFIYMPWSSNLTSYFETNIADFEKAIAEGILKKERVLVFFMTSPLQATLFELKYEKGSNVRATLKEYSDPAFTTAEGIASILNDVVRFGPANRYSMIIGCHGMGWLPVSGSGRAQTSDAAEREKDYWEYEGVPLTRYFGGLSAEYQTDITTLAEGISGAGIKMEYMLFDDCYMSSIEVAYDLRHVTDYLIASPTEVMAYGFPYQVIGKYLVGNVDYQGIASGFLGFYENYSAMPCGTIGITKCSELDALAGIMKEINTKFDFDPSLLGGIQRLDGYTPVIFYDFGDYVSKLCTDAELLEKFENRLERAVPPQYSLHTRTYYSMGKGEIYIDAYSGITTSDPSVSAKAVDKTETAWYKATH